MSWKRDILVVISTAVLTVMLFAIPIIYCTDIPEVFKNANEISAVVADIAKRLTEEEKDKIARSIPKVIKATGDFLERENQKGQTLEETIENTIVGIANSFLANPPKKLKELRNRLKLPRLPGDIEK